MILWWLLAKSSVPLHLLYNSAVFSTLCGRQFNVFLVSREFLDGASFTLQLSSQLQFEDPTLNSSKVLDSSKFLEGYQKNRTSLETLENKACMEAYSAPVISSRSDLLLVSTYSNFTNSLLCFIPANSGTDPPENSQSEFSVMTPTDICNTSEVFVTPKNWLIDLYEVPYPDRDETLPWPPEPAHRICIQYCLSVPVEEHCELQVSLAIIIVVIICNLVKLVCMSIIALS